ncbi:hypothetical protein NPIL_631041 [Nephila pilipes]|uniref:Uncharacterized protein n=1 Tax=Nephila pilipes TaxID=299642 RepID=A0A8X6R676_NEPPI|nr:hypothetical protein NPIL_631041 [Nephila pilipes]
MLLTITESGGLIRENSNEYKHRRPQTGMPATSRRNCLIFNITAGPIKTVPRHETNPVRLFILKTVLFVDECNLFTCPDAQCYKEKRNRELSRVKFKTIINMVLYHGGAAQLRHSGPGKFHLIGWHNDDRTYLTMKKECLQQFPSNWFKEPLSDIIKTMIRNIDL